VVALEVMSTVDGGRYRAQLPGSAAQILDFTAADDSLNVLGPFTQVAKPFSSTSHYLAVYNVGVPGANAYELANVITPEGTTIGISTDGVTGEDRVTLNPPFRFAYASPTQRVFLVDGPVTYLCDTVAGTLLRYEGYDVEANQSAIDSHGELLGNGATASLMANQVEACAFSYTVGTAERGGLVSLQLTVRAQGESVSLLSQIHVDNAP
jgi:MSHA biogenesis protein MshO